MRSIRCSSLPLAISCPASQTPPSLQIEGDDSAARLGSAVHESLAAWITSNGVQPEAASLAAAKLSVSPQEVERLTWQGWSAWTTGGLYKHFPDPECELALEATAGGLRLTGHPDVLSITEDAVYVLDWKTGFADGDFLDQMRGYALLALGKAPAVDKAMVGVVRLREGTVEWLSFDRAGLDAWLERIVAELQKTELYRTGPHCQYCPRAKECPALAKEMNTGLALVLDCDADLANAVPDQLAVAIDRVKLIEAACEAIRQAVKIEVALMGGSAQTSDGRELRLVDQQRREIDAAKAWPVLIEDFSLTELLWPMAFAKGKLEKMAMENAGRGQKKAAKEDLLARLDAVGALVTRTFEPKLECRRNGNATTKQIAGTTADDDTAAD